MRTQASPRLPFGARCRAALTNRSILLQVGTVLVLCQLLAHGLSFAFVAWRFERPDLLNATSVATVQAIGLYETLGAVPADARPRLEAAISNAHPTIRIVEPDSLRNIVDNPASVRNVLRHDIYVGLQRARPEIGQHALLIGDASGNPEKSKIALPLADGRFFTFEPEVGDQRITFPRIVSTLLVSMLVVPLAVIGLWVLRMLTAPLGELARSAERFSIDLDPTPLPETGPAELRSLARALNAMKTRIRHLLDSRSRMLAAVSHDLRTPLTRIRLRIDSMPESEDKARTLRDITTMNEMIAQALSYLRDQASTGKPEPVDLPTLVETICNDFADSGQDARFAGPRNIVLDCEPDLLTRAITNLVDNAIKFGGVAHVSLEARSAAEVVIRIEDDGPGIADADKSMAFEPFTRGNAARSAPEVEGFGLGLAIARQIVERHGGQITLHDRVPTGLCVQIVLPVRRSAHVPRNEPTAPAPISHEAETV